MATPLRTGTLTAAGDVLVVGVDRVVTRVNLTIYNDGTADDTVAVAHRRGATTVKFGTYVLATKKNETLVLDQTFIEGDALELTPTTSINYIITVREEAE